MNRDILGTWEIILTDKGRDASVGRIAFRDHDGALVVIDADPEAAGRPARVELDGDTVRFEMQSPGSSRGNTHHAFELLLHAPDVLTGTRRRGMLARVPVAGRRVSGSEAAAPSVAEAKARAAEAAERASLAAAEAAAALAEAEAIVALDAVRRAAEQAVVHETEATAARSLVSAELLAGLPAPTLPPTFVPGRDVSGDVVSGVPRGRVLPITHRLTRGSITVHAAEAFPGIFVWGGSFAAAEHRLRDAGWTITAIVVEESLAVDAALLEHAASVRDSLVA